MSSMEGMPWQPGFNVLTTETQPRVVATSRNRAVGPAGSFQRRASRWGLPPGAADACPAREAMLVMGRRPPR
eukprot:4037082-Pyramimonas_sp.AAC.1